MLQDKFTEYVFHVTSITNIREQDQGRFSIYLQKKHFEFMAHNDGKKPETMSFLGEIVFQKWQFAIDLLTLRPSKLYFFPWVEQ